MPDQAVAEDELPAESDELAPDTQPGLPTNAWRPGSEAAREAGRKGGAARAARRRADQEATEAARALGIEGALPGSRAAGVGGSSAADADILAALEREAKQGDVAAARAVLEYRRRDQAQGVSPAALRIGLLADQLPMPVLLAVHSTITELVREWEARESPANEGNRERSVEGIEPLPRDRGEQEADPHPPARRDSDGASAADSRPQ